VVVTLQRLLVKALEEILACPITTNCNFWLIFVFFFEKLIIFVTYQRSYGRLDILRSMPVTYREISVNLVMTFCNVSLSRHITDLATYGQWLSQSHICNKVCLLDDDENACKKMQERITHIQIYSYGKVDA
jgi:hypothetical protein